MKKDLLKLLTGAAFIVAMLASCNKKLNLKPTNGITADSAYSSPAGFKRALAKVYASFALTGNQGGTGKPDVSPQIISDEGNSDFLRLYWNLQELTTDEAAWTWQNDAGIQGLHEMSWSSINPIVDGLYYRSFFQITLANDFIRNSSDDALKARTSFSSTDLSDIKKYRAEARLLRAYQYWVLMDIYGNPPFVTEKDPIAVSVPKQIQRKDLFAWLETELKDIDADLADARTNEYGRADKAAAWSLLARMYLNAQVYTGTARNTDAVTYAKKVIGGGYTLHPDYTQLMLADNNLNTDEFIFVIEYDGTNTQNWGGTTYLCHGPAHVPAAKSGTSGDWGGLRCTQNFVGLYSDPSGNTDKRPQFYTTGQNLVMNDLYTGTDGYSTFKFRNVTRNGNPAPHLDPQKNWVDVDFPIFRLAEMYLIYAEAVLRGGSGGDAATALTYVNNIRTRAYGDPSGNITAGLLTTDFILDERARELYYEALRRTDLIRYGKFTTGAYLWAWKGGVKSGTSVNDKYNIFPLPTTDLTANPNLIQNAGY